MTQPCFPVDLPAFGFKQSLDLDHVSVGTGNGQSDERISIRLCAELEIRARLRLKHIDLDRRGNDVALCQLADLVVSVLVVALVALAA
ncbi:hypothetical protein SAMD00023353_0901240 [Rosellinia necatrix]|uniref:Uncharacterized protein n=1 Tax=Rosellinia necatrix TaxID=77044 RepID=A0A1S8A653_ROSNE|nr:hypothetical protein SAMD00023353_0901240 [Rosellinia necatrix]